MSLCPHEEAPCKTPYICTRCGCLRKPGFSPIPTKHESTTGKVLAFLKDLGHPEAYGYAVTAEVRKRARELVHEIEASNARG